MFSETKLLMLRTAGIVIPVYIILVAVTELLHRRRRQRQVRRNTSIANTSKQFHMRSEVEMM
jgi:hypothetical protein